MSSNEISIDSTLIQNMENDVSSAEVETKENAAEDTETTIVGNANSKECYEACNNVVTAMNEALQSDAAKIANSLQGFNEFDEGVAQLLSEEALPASWLY